MAFHAASPEGRSVKETYFPNRYEGVADTIVQLFYSPYLWPNCNLWLVTTLYDLEINNFGRQTRNRSAITLLPCSTSFDSGVELSFALFVVAAA